MRRLLWWVGVPLGVGGVLLSSVWFSGRTVGIRVPDEIPVEDYRSIHVEVLNGCGADGIARRAGATLRRMGFDVMTMGNADSYNYTESLVLDRVGKPEYARLVAQAIGIRHHLQQKVADPFRIEEVTVIIGRDYGRLKLQESFSGSSLSVTER